MYCNKAEYKKYKKEIQSAMRIQEKGRIQFTRVRRGNKKIRLTT